jgi:3',5'-cyclic AMP phosphodiesterase CpdA
MLDKLLNIEVSDYPSTAFKNTLGFGSTGEKGTLGDLASTVLAYHYTNNEDPKNDKFLMNALERFDNNQNAEVILDTLLTVVLDDLLQGEILKNIKIDPISWGINGPVSELAQTVYDMVSGLVGAGDWTGFGIGDVISIILISGVIGGDTLSGVVYSVLDEYLTQSQYEVIDGEFYRILKDLTHDENPSYMADFDGTVNYNGKVAVPLSQDNLRLPSHIAVTFGEDSATSVNISYVTKYSITDTDVQIVPFSEKPDFSKGTTVKGAKIDTNCEIDADREYSAIDLSFIGIIKHKFTINRHTVEITGLEAGQKYCYRIGDADRGWWSDVGVISTADKGTTFSFLHVTDPQGVTEKQYKNNWAMALETAFDNHDIDFLLSTGDMVDNGNDFVEWKRMFNTAADSLMDTVLMAGTGNHEERGENANIQNFAYANLPEQDTTTGIYYSFDYNTAHIAVLNTNDLGEDNALSAEQIEWLKADMGASKKPWKFIALHKAIYSNGSHFDDDDVVAIRAQLLPLMNELDIDLVFQGHDHVYMRTDVMKDNAIVETDTATIKYNGLEYTSKIKPDGTIYSINGTIGPKHYEPKDSSETSELIPDGETVLFLEVPSYSHIQIDGGNLYFDTYSVEDGKETRVDQFAISKTITLSDGTVMDGTTEIVQPGDSIIDDLVNGSSETLNVVLVATASVMALVIAYFITTANIIKRRREDF